MLEALRQAIKEDEEFGEENDGVVAAWSDNGPVSIDTIRVILGIFEKQQKQIKQLESKIDRLEKAQSKTTPQ